LGSGHFERGLDVMRAVLEEIGEAWPKSQASMLAAIAMGRLRLKLRGYGWKRRPASERDLLRLRAYRAVGVGLMSISPVLALAFHSRYVLLSLDVGPAEFAAEALAMEAMYQSLFGDEVTGPLMDQARRIAQEVSLERETRFAVDAGAALIRVQDGDLRGGADAVKIALTGWRQAERSPWLINRGVLGWLHALERLGSLDQLGPALDETLRACAHRGDRLVEEIATRLGCSVWLARDDLEGLQRRLSTAPWVPSEGGYSATMFFDLYARGGLSLYAQDGRGFKELLPGLEEYEGSFLARTKLYRGDALYLRGRLALAEGRLAGLDEAQRCAAALANAPLPYFVVWAQLLNAGIAVRTGQNERAITALHGAIERARALSMDLYAHVAMRRAGQLKGGLEGDRLVLDADAELLKLGVRRPDAFSGFIAPGFD
jgi:hypothetical protein